MITTNTCIDIKWSSTVLYYSQILTNFICTTTCKVGSVIARILLMKKSRHSEFRTLLKVTQLMGGGKEVPGPLLAHFHSPPKSLLALTAQGQAPGVSFPKRPPGSLSFHTCYSLNQANTVRFEKIIMFQN